MHRLAYGNMGIGFQQEEKPVPIDAAEEDGSWVFGARSF